MTLTPSQASKLRAQILHDISTDGHVEIDSRFIKPLFGSTGLMHQWARRWDIHHETYIRAGEFRRNREPIQWVSFSNRPEETLIIFIDDQL